MHVQAGHRLAKSRAFPGDGVLLNGAVFDRHHVSPFGDTVFVNNIKEIENFATNPSGYGNR